jgi:hypothetical protein
MAVLAGTVRLTDEKYSHKAEHVACMVIKRRSYKMLAMNPGGKRPLGRTGLNRRIRVLLKRMVRK